MKYIKEYMNKFEDEYYYPWRKDEDNRGEMWKVSLKPPDFEICLKKIGMPEDKIPFWIKLSEDTMKKDLNRKFVDYSHVIVQKLKKGGFTWSRCDEWFRGEDNASFKYKGELNATEEEIRDYWYQIELEKDTNKYNL